MIAPSKPTWLSVLPAHIPPGLRDDAWVVWKGEWRQNAQGDWKWTKPPYQLSGQYAKSTNPATWASFNDVVAAYYGGAFDGIGRVFCADDPYTVIDLDHCRDPDTGKVDQWAVDLIELLRTYTEISPSTTGIRMVTRAKLPEGSRNRKGNVEIYDDARYCTFTGSFASRCYNHCRSTARRG